MTARLELIPTVPGMGRGLISHDERSKAYRAVDLLGDSQTPRDRRWRRGHAYDQGQTSECVAYTGKGVLNTALASAKAPYRTRSRYDTEQFYRGAQTNDEWPGEAYDGTSGLGLLRYLTRIGLVTEYRTCFGIDDVVRTVSHIGPVMIGIGWTNDMFTPDSDGFIRPTGGFAGGHEIEVTGNVMSDRAVEVTNSWGPGWGDRGRARIAWTDLETLLGDRGDAYVITGVAERS